MTQVERDILYGRITRRLVPYLMVIYTVAFLDRVNISFAALTMNRDLGISETIYGFAAGVFFLSYCLVQVPANMTLIRVGARRWLAILMVLWGIDCIATAFVAGAPTYILARLLLGIAEAGFFPGIIFYFTLWLPPSARTRVLGTFLLSLPMCNALGSPVSAHLLLLEGVAGLHGWQWLFILESAPAVLLGIVTWFVLTDSPSSATWLSPHEKEWLAADMRSEMQSQSSRSGLVWTAIIRDCASYFLWSTANYGFIFFLPKILSARGASPIATGWWATLTYGVGALSMFFACRNRGFRSLPLLFLFAGMGFAVAALAPSLTFALAGFCLAAIGLMAAVPMFWSLTSSRLTGKASGAAIAIVNACGAVGGFVGPYAIGWLRDATHAYTTGLWAIAACLAVGAALVLIDARASQTPALTPAEGR